MFAKRRKKRACGSELEISNPSQTVHVHTPSTQVHVDNPSTQVPLEPFSCLPELKCNTYENVEKMALPATEWMRGCLPEWLRVSNGRMWEQFIKELHQRHRHAILVWGPSGCGKTRGIEDCAKACGLRPFYIEPSELTSTEQVHKWIDHITHVNTLLGPRIVLVDCVEGMDLSHIQAFESILLSRPLFATPVVFVADSLYCYHLQKMFSLIPTKFRMFAPSTHNCIQFAKLTFARTSRIEHVQREADRCNGNLRVMKNHLLWHWGSSPTRTISVFESTKNMLCKKASVDLWIMGDEPSMLSKIVFDNCTTLLRDLDQISDIATLLDHSAFHNGSPIFLYASGLHMQIACNFRSEREVPLMTLRATSARCGSKPVGLG